MDLIVGQNCYTDITDANDLINTFLESNDPIRIYWGTLSDNDKKAIILKTTLLFDNDDMCYKKFKLDVNQPMQFPRIDVYKRQIDTPLEIKLGLLIQGTKTSITNKYNEYQEMKAQGIRSYKIKDASVEFFESVDLNDIDTSKSSNGMYDLVFNQYFKRYCDLI